MSDPVLIEVTRNAVVESRHRGAFAIVDASGSVVCSAGDIDRPVYPRSSVKILQALPLVENGWADRFGFTEAELALACASHSGDPIHTETAAAMLDKVGLTTGALECGVHWPSSKRAARALAGQGFEPSALHNNCSGKHAGFLCVACGMETDPRGYVQQAHPVQAAIKAALRDVYGIDLGAAGTDGCSIPTFAVPLRTLARAFARLVTGEGFGPQRFAAAERLRRAVAAHPVMVAGEGRLDTVLSERFGERVFTKTGAEGVFCAALPERGWGLALKCDDGAQRGSEAILLHLLATAMIWTPDDHAALASHLDPVLRNWNGIEVGRLQGVPALSDAVRAVTGTTRAG